MNVFKFLDEAVRGAILFLFDFFYITGTLLRHPLSGPTMLMRRKVVPDEQHISSLTYLVLAMLLAVANAVGTSDIDHQPNIFQSVLNGAFSLIGTSTDSVLHLLFGATAGTIFLAALLRFFAWVKGLSPRHRHRFVCGAEYVFGLSVISITLLTVVFGWQFYLMDSLGQDIDMVSTLAIALAFSLIHFMIYVIPVIALGAQFYTGLLRKPLPEIPNEIELWRLWRTKGWRKYREARRSQLYRFYGLDPDTATHKEYVPAALKWTFRALPFLVGPLLVAGGALLVGSFLANQILRQRNDEPAVRILLASCNLSAAEPNAVAFAWNSSEDPQVNWVNGVRLSAQTYSPSGEQRVFPLDWSPALPAGRITDALRPKEGMELSAPIGIPAESIFVTRDPAASCSVDIPSAEEAIGDFLRILEESVERE